MKPCSTRCFSNINSDNEILLLNSIFILPPIISSWLYSLQYIHYSLMIFASGFTFPFCSSLPSSSSWLFPSSHIPCHVTRYQLPWLHCWGWWRIWVTVWTSSSTSSSTNLYIWKPGTTFKQSSHLCRDRKTAHTFSLCKVSYRGSACETSAT